MDRTIDSQKRQRHYHTNDSIVPHRQINTLKPNMASNILMFNTKTTTLLTLRKKLSECIFIASIYVFSAASIGRCWKRK